MPTCPSCGATVSDAAAYCGECGTDVSTAGDTGDLGTEEQIKQRVEQKAALEDDGWLGPRAKGALYLISGVALLAFGYWIGFVGYTEYQYGPQGFGLYQITYPIMGIIILLFGGLLGLGGFAGLAGEEI